MAKNIKNTRHGKIGKGFKMADFVTDFTKKLVQADYSRNPREIFSDFLTMAANSLANVIYKNEEIEKEYLSIVSKYKNPNIFPELFAMIVNELEKEPFQDLLGKIYMQGNYGNSNAGQFFTPFHISDFMAQISIYEDDLKKKSKKMDTLQFQTLVWAPVE